MVCDPCHRMDELRPGLRAELDGKRGMLAHVVEGGEIALGDAIESRLAPRQTKIMSSSPSNGRRSNQP